MKNKNLFEDPDKNEPISNNESDLKRDKKEGTAKKIVQNDYNMGTYEFENFGEIRIHSDSTIFADNFFDHYEKKILKEKLFEIYKDSPYSEKYQDIRRVQKNDIMEIFYMFYNNPKIKEFSCVDRFTESCNFLNFDYKYVFYNMLPNEKEIIVRAIDEEYGVVRVSKIKRLF